MAKYDEHYLKSSIDRIKTAIEGLTEEQLKYKQAENSWSITEVVQHLVDHHLVVSFRIRAILASNEPVNFVTFNQDNWVSSQVANHTSIDSLLSFYQALLSYNQDLFFRVDTAELQKFGINAKGLEVSVEQIIKGLVDHVQHHIQQIDRIKQALTKLELKEEVR